MALLISVIGLGVMLLLPKPMPGFWAGLIAIWAFFGLPLLLVLGALRTGLRANGALFTKLAQGFAVFALCFVIVIIGFAP